MVVGLLLAGDLLGVGRRQALFVLVVSTVCAHAGTLAPAGWVGDRWFYLAFLFPIPMSFVIDADELNEASRDRFRRVAASVSVALRLLSLDAWRFFSNLLSPDSPRPD